VTGSCHPVSRGAGPLDAACALTDNFRKCFEQEAITVEVPHVETPEESLDRLRLEAEELRASRERLVLAADADRRRIERDLHDGPQQHLVALAVNLQLARRLTDADPAAAKALLDEMRRDVQQALDETGELAHRIYPPLLEAGGLAAAVRAAAASAGVPTRIEVATGAGYPPEVAGAVYFCCLEVLERAGDGARATVTVRDEEGALAFEVVEDGTGSAATACDGLGPLRDRVEALGGRVTIQSEPGCGTRVSGSLPPRDEASRSQPDRGSRP
jgi:signal transduction histidine kinase